MARSKTTRRYLVTELLGDGIGAELSQAVRTLAASLPVDIHFESVDLSLESRRAGGEAPFDAAIASLERTRCGLKYPTVTETDTETESPNAILRRRCLFTVIHRPVVTIPGLPTNFRGVIDLDVVRIAVGGTYEEPGHRIGYHAAVSIRVIERIPCRQAALFAFELARRKGTHVISASKPTIQRATDGLFEQVVAEVAVLYPDVPHQRELFDALLAKIVLHPDSFRVIVTPNEYGDFLSDFACGLIGSMGLGDSSSYAFGEDGEISLALFDPAGGAALDIAGQDKANPTAAFFALSSLLGHLGEHQIGQALKDTVLAALSSGHGTPDVGGSMGTTEFAAHVQEKLAENGHGPQL